jgi:membrane protease YdiL (CAAX protease family)
VMLGLYFVIAVPVTELLARLMRIPGSNHKPGPLRSEFKPAVLVTCAYTLLSLAVLGVMLHYKTGLEESLGSWNSFSRGWLSLGALGAVVILLPMILHIRLKKIDLSVLGLSSPHRLHGVAAGLLAGLLWIYLNNRSISALGGDLSWTVRASIFYLLVTANEELMFRGYLQRISIARFGIVRGIAVAALGFTFVHLVKIAAFSGLTFAAMPVTLLTVLISTLFFGYLAYRFGNILAPLILHFIIILTMIVK